MTSVSKGVVNEFLSPKIPERRKLFVSLNDGEMFKSTGDCSRYIMAPPGSMDRCSRPRLVKDVMLDKADVPNESEVEVSQDCQRARLNVASEQA